MQEQTRYQQLQPEDRMTIASMSQQGSSKRAMARLLGRSPSTISREIKRNAHSAKGYASHTAQVRCFARRRAARPSSKLDTRSAVGLYVRCFLISKERNVPS